MEPRALFSDVLAYTRVLLEDRSYFGEGPFFDLGCLRLSVKRNIKLNEFCCEIAPWGLLLS
jgi:hypothetical protein